MADHDLGREMRDDPVVVQDFSTPKDSRAASLPATVGANLRRLRARSGLSLEKLASISGVSRGMIGRIEMGRSTPTVGLLSQLADALGVQLVSLITVRETPAASVLRHGSATTIESSDGKFVVRPLFKRHAGVEFFEIAIAGAHFEEAERREPGAIAHVVVASGAVVVKVAGEQPATLAARDAIIFPADVAHGYHNIGDEDAILYLTLSPSASPA